MRTRQHRSPAERLDPAKSVVEKLGGVDVVARVTGRHVSRIYSWMYPLDRGGTGGFIPSQHQQLLLDWARREGLDLRPDDFFLPPPTDAHQPAPEPAAAEAGR